MARSSQHSKCPNFVIAPSLFTMSLSIGCIPSDWTVAYIKSFDYKKAHPTTITQII